MSVVTEYALLELVETKLAGYKWDDNPSNEVVFAKNAAIITPLDVEEVLAHWGAIRAPFALIVPSRNDRDSKDPRFGTITFYVVIGASILAQEASGRAFLMGAHKIGGSGTSDGRGILEIQEEVRDAIGHLTRDDNLTITCRMVTAYDVDRLTGESEHIGVRQLMFVAEV